MDKRRNQIPLRQETTPQSTTPAHTLTISEPMAELMALHPAYHRRKDRQNIQAEIPIAQCQNRKAVPRTNSNTKNHTAILPQGHQ
jgi:hypothetical protein